MKQYRVTYDSIDQIFVVNSYDQEKPNMEFKMHESGIHCYNLNDKSLVITNNVSGRIKDFPRDELTMNSKQNICTPNWSIHQCISSVARPSSTLPPYPFSRISVTAVLGVLHLHRRDCPPPVSASYLVYHPHYPPSLPRLHCRPPASLLLSSLHYLPPSRLLCRRCLSAFSDWMFSLLCIVLHYTAQSALLHTKFLTILSDLLPTLFSSLLACIFSLSVMFLLCYNQLRFYPLTFTPLCSNITILLRSVYSDPIAPYLLCSIMIDPICLYQLAQI